MYIKMLPLGVISANCYIICDGEGNGAVVDPGDYSSALESEIIKAGIKKLQYILCTHGHFDHISGAAELKEKHPEAQIVSGVGDAPALMSGQFSLADYFGLPYQPCRADKTVENGDKFSVGSIEFTVIDAPGHSLGGVIYYCTSENVMFTGDTIFKGSVGRTDLYGGDYTVLMKTLKRLQGYPSETVLYTGHGEKTSIAYELKYNPYLR